MLGVNGNLTCFAIGHMVHVKGCLAENLIGIVCIFLIFTKGTWPSLLCHSKSTPSFRDSGDVQLFNTSVLLVEGLSKITGTFLDCLTDDLLQDEAGNEEHLQL